MIKSMRKSTDEEILKYCRQPRVVFPLPTQIHIAEPRMCIPRYGRAFRTDLWLREGEVIPFHKLQLLPDFTNTNDARYTAVYMVELYENYADDGHIDMALVDFHMFAVRYEASITWETVNKAEPRE